MNYSTYYSRGQKVFLINTTPGRDENLFDAFSATVSACDNRHIELKPRYPLNHSNQNPLKEGMKFKLTAESFGAGVQISGTVSHISSSGFRITPRGSIEMYQRSQVPRIDTIMGFRSFSRNAPLALFHSEWARYSGDLNASSSAKLELEPTQINLGLGGLRYFADQTEQQSDLSLVFIQIAKAEPPICAVTEHLWRRSLPDNEGFAIGRRFVLIRKSDQHRIQAFINHDQMRHGKTTPRQKSNWELLDRMSNDKNV